MDKRIKKCYVPMTEISFYLLFASQNEMHGYGLMQYVKELRDGEIVSGAGAVYTSFTKYVFEKCENEAVTYQIDFNPNKQEKDEYVQMFSDFGWQLVTEKEGKFYF